MKHNNQPNLFNPTCNSNTTNVYILLDSMLVRSQPNFDDEIKHGLYLKVFCNGMDEVLEDYRNEIVDLENTILKDPQLPLTFVVSRIEKYITLFDALKSMIRVVKSENVHGCLLMGRLHKYYDCGVKIVVDAATKYKYLVFFRLK